MGKNVVVRIVLASAFAFSLAVAMVIGALSLWLLVALGRTNGYENLVIVALCTFSGAFLAGLTIAKRVTTAALVSVVSTCIVVGGGFALLYAIFASLCGSSDC